jgi:oxygen-independent coproporphyrinogen-3 oxidase
MILELLSGLNEYRSLSLYIHIPFCSRKCDYCDFYSTDAFTQDVLDTYARKLISEINHARSIRTKGFSTIFIGGGNPGILGGKRLADIIRAADPDGDVEEVTVELNPESVDRNLLDQLSSYATRLSIGIQSLHDQNLKTLGRNTGRSESIRALKLLSCYQDTFEISLDFIDAVPGQGLYDTRDDILSAHELLKIDHLSVYDLIVEPGTPLSERVSDEVDGNGNVIIDQYDLSDDLKHLGYQRYEISNWARGHKNCAHNQHYWRMDPYLGIGPAAVSLLYKDHQVYHLYGKKDLHGYIFENSEFSDRIYTVEKLSGIEFLEEQLIMGIRTTEGISIKRLSGMFSTDLRDVLLRAAAPWIERGCMQASEEERLMLTESGMKFTNAVLVDLLIGIEGHIGVEPLALDTYF